MKKPYQTPSIIFLIILSILLELYGPLYILHNEKNAAKYVKENIISLFDENNYSYYYDIPKWYNGKPKIEVRINYLKEIEIPDILNSSMINKETIIIDKQRIGGPYYQLKFDVYLKKKGLTRWSLVSDS